MKEMAWWISKPGFSSLLETFHTFSWGGPRYGLDDFKIALPWPGFMALLSFIYFILLLCGLRSDRQNRKMVSLIFLWLIMPVSMVYIYSFVSDVSFFAIKHFIIALPAFCIITAKGLSSLNQGRRILILMLIALLSFLPLSAMYSNFYSIDWKSSAEYVKKNIKEGDAVVISSLTEVMTFIYYFDRKKRSLEDMDIYGKITQDNYNNSVFWAGHHNLIIGVKQAGFGNTSITSESDFLGKLASYPVIKEKPVWTMVSRWSDPDISAVIFSSLEKYSHKTECRNFQGVEVCRFDPGIFVTNEY